MASWKVWQEVPAAIGAGFSSVHRRLDELEHARRVVEVTPPFVGVVVFGEGKAICAASGYVRDYRQSFEIDPMVEILNGQVVVFADWQQLEIEGIFCGVDVLVYPSPCIGRFERCVPGQKLRVNVRRREGTK